MAKKPATKKVNKSAVDGQFVPKQEIKKHPKTTYQQSVKAAAKRPQKKG